MGHRVQLTMMLERPVLPYPLLPKYNLCPTAHDRGSHVFQSSLLGPEPTGPMGGSYGQGGRQAWGVRRKRGVGGYGEGGESMSMHQKSDKRKHDKKIIQNPNDIAFV